MAEAKRSAGLSFSVEAEHRDSEGNLIVRHITVHPPVITCIRPSCLYRYVLKSWCYTWVMLYHKYRMQHAERHRHDNIDEKYRTGEPSPQSIRQAIYEIIKLKLRR